MAIGIFLLYPYVRIYFVEVRPRVQFPQKVQTQVSPTELQNWAMSCLQQWDTNYPYYPQPITNVHPALRDLWIHKPTAVMYLASENDMAYVMVYYGAGGSGHWGVEIGPTNRPTPQSSVGRRYTQWSPGLCFFDGQ